MSEPHLIRGLCSIFTFTDHHKTLVEPACGAALASIYAGVIQKLQAEEKLPKKLGPVIIVVCGGYGVNNERIEEWKQQVGL